VRSAVFTLTLQQVTAKALNADSAIDPTLLIAVMIASIGAVWALKALGRALGTMLDMLRLVATTVATTLLAGLFAVAVVALLIRSAI